MSTASPASRWAMATHQRDASSGASRAGTGGSPSRESIGSPSRVDSRPRFGRGRPRDGPPAVEERGPSVRPGNRASSWSEPAIRPSAVASRSAGGCGLRTGHGVTSRGGLDPQQRAAVLVGQQVQEPIRPLAHSIPSRVGRSDTRAPGQNPRSSRAATRSCGPAG